MNSLRFAPLQGDCALLKRQNAELRLGFEAEEGRLRRAFNIELDEALTAARSAEEARAKAVVEVQCGCVREMIASNESQTFQ